MNCRRCDCDMENISLIANAMNEVLTERYAVFRKQRKFGFLFWTFNTTDEELVRIPKRYRGNYQEDLLAMKKEIVSLIDRGYHNEAITMEIEQDLREQIAEYQIGRGKVWE